MNEHQILAIIGTAFVGAAVFVLCRTISNSLESEDASQGDHWRYDITRINELRRHSLIYRLFYPLIQVLAPLNRRAFRSDLPLIGREILAAGLSRFWTPEEYLAYLEIIALLCSPFLLYLCMSFMGVAGIVPALGLIALVAFLLRRRLTRRAQHRLMRIKRRLPFLLDLLTLLMEAGSTFLQSLKEAVTEFQEHPVGEEFGRVLAEMNMGKNRSAALESLRGRLSDDEITSIVGSIIQGENLGTPLALLFRTQSDVLRIKRTQRAETMAGEAGVKMLLPAVLVMASTVLVILGPFIVAFVYQDFLQ